MSRDEQREYWLEIFDELPDDSQERMLRLAQRIAALPRDMQKNLTREKVQFMFDNDVDYPFN